MLRSCVASQLVGVLAGLLLCSSVLHAQQRPDTSSVSPKLASSSSPVAAAVIATSKSVKRPIAKSQTIDIRLDMAKTLRGKAMDRQSRPLPNTRLVLIGQHNRTPRILTTDSRGQFAASGLRPGLFSLVVQGETQAVRLWNASVAPPHASQELLLVAGTTVRGQCAGGANCNGCDACGGGFASGAGGGHFGGIFQRALQNPWLIGLGTAAAIAIPLATDDDDDNSGRGEDGDAPDAS